jgi:hypothetical protein
MLSPGTAHKMVPRDPEPNLRFRAKLLAAPASLHPELAGQCRNDILFWINIFGYQYDPRRAKGKVGPFCTWPFQDDAALAVLGAVEDQADLLIEKSRDMGASWLCLYVMAWLWLFHPMNKFLLVSRDEAAVDKPGDPDSLFWKLDFVLKHLPPWMLPPGSFDRQKLLLANRANGSNITGQASTGKAGVGGRATAAFIDEYSRIREDREVYQGTADTADCRVFNGTHMGTKTMFYEVSRRKTVRKLVMHWSQHPRKNVGLYKADPLAPGVPQILDKQYQFPPDYPFVLDGSPGGPYPGLRSAWYDGQLADRRTKQDAARDLDIDPEGTITQFFDPGVVRRLIQDHCRHPVWEGDIEVEKATGKVVRLTRLPGGPLKIWQPLDSRDRPAPSKYGAGADISNGTGATPSCCSVVDAATGVRVAEYSISTLTPDDFAPKVVAVCRLFAQADGTSARLAWEANGPGGPFGKKVYATGFRNFHRRTSDGTGVERESDLMGWWSGEREKTQLLHDYREALYAGGCVNPSAEALAETALFTFVRNTVEHAQARGRNPDSAAVNHADRVIADALAWKMAAALGAGAVPREEPAADGDPPPLSLAWRMARHRRDELEAAEAF